LANLQAQEIARHIKQIYDLARSSGYDVAAGVAGIATGKLVYCYAERQHQFLIDFKADVFKCSVGKFGDQERVGHITEDGFLVCDKSRWHSWVSYEGLATECAECVYLPLCMGGCPKIRARRPVGDEGCALIAANSSYLLKRLALGEINTAIRDSSRKPDAELV
jgi:uncharacterized protein